MIERGLVIVEGPHTWWQCPNCRRKLGELRSGKLIIKVGQRFLMIHLSNDQVQRCPNPNCGTDSLLPAPQRVA